MVKLHTPLSSLGASGSIGKAITVSNWKGRHYLKTKSAPDVAATAPQRAQRAAMGWLAKQWLLLSEADALSWSEPAKATNISKYNAFLQDNMTRIATDLGPTKAWPAAESADLPGWSFVLPYTFGAVHAVTLKYRLTPFNAAWGVIFYLSGIEGVSFHASNLFQIAAVPDDTNQRTLIKPLSPGTWYFRFRPFTTDGVLGGSSAEKFGISLSS